MSNAGDRQRIKRITHAFGAADFTGVNRCRQARLTDPVKSRGKLANMELVLIPSHAKPDHIRMRFGDHGIGNIFGSFGAQMANAGDDIAANNTEIFLGIVNSLDSLKTFVEPEGCFSPGVGSYGIYFWVYDKDAKRLFAPTMQSVNCEHGLMSERSRVNCQLETII